MTLNIQSSFTAVLLLLQLVSGFKRVQSILWTAFVTVLLDMFIKIGYFYYWIKRVPQTLEKRRQKIIIEAMSMVKDFLVCILIVDYALKRLF